MYESYSDLLEATAKLEEYAEVCNDELGEYWTKLVSLVNSCDTGMSDEFEKAYHVEVASQLAYLKEHATIIEDSEVISQTINIKKLKWDYEE